MRYISSMKLRLQQVEISTDLANNTCANRTNQMLSLVCVFLFSVEQSQFFSWRGIGRIKGICMCVSKGGGGAGVLTHPPPPPPPTGKSHKYSNTGPDPPKNHKVRSHHSMLGHHRHASETPFKWRLAGMPMMARF